MRSRVLLASLLLVTFALLHTATAVVCYRARLPAGIWLTFGLFAAGCSATAAGLLTRRYWARYLTLGIGVVALVEILTMAVILSALGLPIPWSLGLPQIPPFVGLVALMLGPRMRAVYDEGPMSPWRFEGSLARLTRVAIIVGVGAVPMLCFMAAHAVYAADPTPRWMAVGAAATLAFGLVLVVRARTAGLPLLAGGAVLGAIAAVWTVRVYDTSPGFAGQTWYWPQTLLGAVSTAPGLLVAILLVAAFVPRIVRFSRAP
jgi:hypothetical protein